MLTYKYLDADIELIKKEVSQYITDYGKYQVGFTKISVLDLLEVSPYLRQWFTLLQCDPVSVYVIRTPHGSSKENAHIDNWIEKSISEKPNTSSYALAINLPLENTEDTQTEFYEYIDGPVKNLEFGSYDVVYQYYGKATLNKIDSYTLSKAVVLNTSIPHSVINFTGKDRFALTFRFKQDPWHLF